MSRIRRTQLEDEAGDLISAANPLDVTGPLTDTELRATEVPISMANRDVLLYDAAGNALTSTVNADRTTNLDGVRGLDTNAMTFGRVSDTIVKGVRLDASTEAGIGIDYEHHEIHGGTYYRAGYQKAVPNGGTANLVITTPNSTTHLHFRPAVDVELEAQIQIFENPTSVTGGTAVTPRNANRNYSDASVAIVVSDAAIDTTGAIPLVNVVKGSGKSCGGSSTANFEWVLKANTKYIFLVTNRVSGVNEVNIRCSWYEHAARN